MLHSNHLRARATLLTVVVLTLAILALLPLGALLAQQAPVQSVLSAGGNAPHIRPESSPIPVIDGEVTDLLLKGKQLEIRYQNTGTIATTIVGELQVRDSSGELVVAVPFVEARRVEAGRKEKFNVAMPKLAAGDYLLYAVVDFGGESMTAAQAALKVQQ